MGFDHHDHHRQYACNTGLNLGLGFTAAGPAKKPSNSTSTITTTTTTTTTNFEPSLTLALSGGGGGGGGGGDHGNPHDHQPYYNNSSNRSIKIDVNKSFHDNNNNNNNSNNIAHDNMSPGLYGRQASPHSAVSSFSGGGGLVKRERDVLSSEEAEIDHEKAVISSRASDEDEDGSNARKKLRLTKEQSALLEESFKQHSTLNPKQKQALARQLNLRPRQVEVWFQNRRARTKLKQTEVDCEFLKKCCETLTDENRRLQKELQELKALKLAQPLYMHMPAATLTMCPSCERIGGGGVAGIGGGAGGDIVVGAGGNTKSPFSMAAKPHFYNPFTNPSAAC